MPTWLTNRWITTHQTTQQEIADLLGVAERDLADSEVPGLSPDWRLAIAYNAALQIASAALAAEGYRAAREQHHYRVIQSLAFTLKTDPRVIAALEAFRKRRNVADYERAGTVSIADADEITELTRRLYADLQAWLTAHHPNLVPERA